MTKEILEQLKSEFGDPNSRELASYNELVSGSGGCQFNPDCTKFGSEECNYNPHRCLNKIHTISDRNLRISRNLNHGNYRR